MQPTCNACFALVIAYTRALLVFQWSWLIPTIFLFSVIILLILSMARCICQQHPSGSLQVKGIDYTMWTDTQDNLGSNINCDEFISDSSKNGDEEFINIVDLWDSSFDGFSTCDVDKLWFIIWDTDLKWQEISSNDSDDSRNWSENGKYLLLESRSIDEK